MLKFYLKTTILAITLANLPTITIHASDNPIQSIEKETYRKLRIGRENLLIETEAALRFTLFAANTMLDAARDSNHELAKPFEEKSKEIETDLKKVTKDLAALRATPNGQPLPPLRFEPARQAEQQVVQQWKEDMFRELKALINNGFDRVKTNLDRPGSPTDSAHK